MAREDAIKRQLTLIKLLKKRKCSLETILEHLNSESERTGYDLSISSKTFQRDCKQISQIWGIEISYQKQENVYFLIDDEEILTNRLIESLDLVSILNQARKVGKYFYLESRKSSGIQYFHDIVYAIENGYSLQFTLNSFHADKTVRKCKPIAIKETHNRYYLVAWDLEKKEFRNYGLDRVTDFKIVYEKHITPEIDVESRYQHAFGIECDEKPVNVVLRFHQYQKNYLNSLPLHPSQKMIQRTDSTIDVELFVHPTNELVMEILKYGAICEVIRPKSLRDKVKMKVKEFYQVYFETSKEE